MEAVAGVTLLTSVLTSGVFGLVIGTLFYFLLPKAIAKVGKYVDAGTLEKVGDGLGKLISIKSAMDTDPKNEDMVEKILRYTELAVHAAEQTFKAGKDKGKKKQFAKDMAIKLLSRYQGKEATELETDIVDGLIETVIGVQKKIQAQPMPQHMR